MRPLTQLLTAAVLVATALGFAARAAVPDLPPAVYKPLAVGTVLDYGSWRCEVVESGEFASVCADGAKRAHFFARFVVYGAPDKDGYAGSHAGFLCDDPQFGPTYLPGYVLSLPDDARDVFRALWPLKLGNKAKLVLRDSVGTGRMEFELSVPDSEKLTWNGTTRDVYRVSAEAVNNCLDTGYVPVRSEAGSFGNIDIQLTWWVDQESGLILKHRRFVPRLDAGEEYTLKTVTYPGSGSLTGLSPGSEQKAADQDRPGMAALETAFWDLIKDSAEPKDFMAYLQRFPDGRFADLARDRLAVLTPGSSQQVAVPTPPDDQGNSAAVADLDFGTYHALVIGNNGYRNLPVLKTAVNDAEAVARRLRDDYAFDAKLLLNATRDEVIDQLAQYRALLQERDNLLIYYAGHGVLDDVTGTGYWLPVDAERDSPSKWISVNDITTMLRAIRARHVMVVSDSCYSGTLVRGASVRLRTTTERTAWVKRMLEKRARTALVSGGLEPVEDSGGGGHSVFAKEFLNALRENTGVMEGERLFDRVKRPVVLNAHQTPQYSDVRFAGHEGGDFLFVRRR